MNRRSFLGKSLAVLAGAVSLSPDIFIPKFEAVRWKQPRKLVLVENPLYQKAEYELFIQCEPNQVRMFKRGFKLNDCVPIARCSLNLDGQFERQFSHAMDF